MRIKCAKSVKPLGVRGYGEAGFVFCPDPAKRAKSRRKKYSGVKTPVAKCLKCDYYRGEHLTMDVDLIFENPLTGKSAVIGGNNGNIDSALARQEQLKVEDIKNLSTEELLEWHKAQNGQKAATE